MSKSDITYEGYDRETVVLALQYLSENRKISQAIVASGIKKQKGMERARDLNNTNVSSFINGRSGLRKEEVLLLPGVFGCASIKEMIDKANEVAKYLEPPIRIEDRKALSASLWILCAACGKTLARVGRDIGVETRMLKAFSSSADELLGILADTKIRELPKALGFTSLQEMLAKTKEIELGREGQGRNLANTLENILALGSNAPFSTRVADLRKQGEGEREK